MASHTAEVEEDTLQLAYHKWYKDRIWEEEDLDDDMVKEQQEYIDVIESDAFETLVVWDLTERVAMISHDVFGGNDHGYTWAVKLD